MFKKTVLIDLDGVLNDYKGDYRPNAISPIKKGAKEFLKQISQSSKIVVFTARNVEQTKLWLHENNLTQYIEDVTNVKIPAFVMIDDRCIRFDGDFDNIPDKVNNFTPYWKNKK